MLVFSNKNSKYKGQEYDPTSSFFEDSGLWDNILNKLNLNDKSLIAKEEEEALFLTQILREIKQGQDSGEINQSIIGTFLFDTKILHDKLTRHSKLTTTSGNNLEEMLVSLVNMAASEASQKRGGGSRRVARKVGGKNVTIDASFLQEDVYNYIIENGLSPEQIGETIFVKMKNQSFSQNIYRLSKVQGKIDVQVGDLSDLIIGLESTDNLTRFLTIVSNATFQAKNYKGNSVQISFGNADYLRAWSGAFSFAGVPASATDIKKLYHSSRNGSAMFFHQGIRFIYELTGLGQANNVGELNPTVKFLVVNDPSGSGISVFSIKAIINQFLTEIVGNPEGYRSTAFSFSHKSGKSRAIKKTYV